MKTRTKKHAILTASCAVMTWSTAIAEISVGDQIFYFHGDGPGESLAATSDGKKVYVASPIEQDDGNFQSFMPRVINKTNNVGNPFTQSINASLGGGEVTDLAPFHPQAEDPREPFVVVNVRDDDLFEDNVLYVIQGQNVVQTIFLPDSADGIKLSPDGNLLVVAVEKDEEIHVYDSSGGGGNIALAAVIDKAALQSFFEEDDPQGDDPEPESIAIAGDGTFALVSIQDASAVAAVDLTTVTASLGSGEDPNAVGDAALVSVVKLPFGFEGENGAIFGTNPDGVCISPDQTFAVAMGEANRRAKHLQSISVLDLTGGLDAITQQTYCIFDIDGSLLANTELTECPEATEAYPVDADKLPRLDPASCEIVERGGITLGALVIERYQASDVQENNSEENETNGSLLLLDLTEALDGIFGVIDRVPIGAEEGARLEAIDSGENGRWMFISISNGGGDEGTFARVEILEE